MATFENSRPGTVAELGPGGRCLATLHALVSSTLRVASLSAGLSLTTLCTAPSLWASTWPPSSGCTPPGSTGSGTISFAFLDRPAFNRLSVKCKGVFIVLRYQERGLEAMMLIPQRDQITIRVRGLLASSILFVKQGKRQRDFSNPPLHVFVFFFSLSFTEELSLCPQAANCPG